VLNLKESRVQRAQTRPHVSHRPHRQEGHTARVFFGKEIQVVDRAVGAEPPTPTLNSPRSIRRVPASSMEADPFNVGRGYVPAERNKTPTHTDRPTIPILSGLLQPLSARLNYTVQINARVRSGHRLTKQAQPSEVWTNGRLECPADSVRLRPSKTPEGSSSLPSCQHSMIELEDTSYTAGGGGVGSGRLKD